MPVDKKGGWRDLLFFLLTLLAIAGAASYVGAPPFDRGVSVLAQESFPYGQYDGPVGKMTMESMSLFDEQVFHAKLRDGDEDCWVEIRLLRRTRPR